MKKILIAILSLSALLTACKKDTKIIDAPGETTIKFDSKAGASEFELNKEFTINNRTYSFNKLRYWVSNLKLIDTKGNKFSVPDSYYLIEETGALAIQDGNYTYPATKREDIKVTGIPNGDYASIEFSIGIEQKYNDNLSLQVGELSQLNGMTNISWMWHTSYIFTAIGGTVKDGTNSKTIKAETGLNTNYKTVTLNLPVNIKVGSQTPTSVLINVDVAKILDGIDLISTPTIGAGQAGLMSQLADNYTKAFSIVSAQ